MPRSIYTPLEASKDVRGLTDPLSNPSRRRTSSSKLLEERAAAAETVRRRTLSATGPEAVEHKAAAEGAQQYAAMQSRRLGRASCERSRQRIFQEVSEACERGSISAREWMAWAADHPECLDHERRGRRHERDEADDEALQLTLWEEHGLAEWSFAKGEKMEDERVRDELLYCGPTGEIVTPDHQAPALPTSASAANFARRQGVMSRAMGFLGDWMRKVKY
nr:hypothetical protein CFP56_33697 [Quercus suber]